MIIYVIAKRLEPATSTPTIVSPLIDVELPEGETLTLKCKVAGEPKPEVKWYLNSFLNEKYIKRS